MLTCLQRAPRPAQSMEPSPLLSFLAGEFAGRVAERWPAPHAVFLTADAPRRHLVCFALAVAGDAETPDLDRLLHAPLQRAIKLALVHRPAGLARALGRLGESAWTAEDYRRLLDLLDEHHAAKILRHASSITPNAVRVLNLLPAPLRKVGLGRLDLTPDQAALVAEGCAALANHHEPEAWASAPLRWANAATPAALFEHIRDDLEPELPARTLPGSDLLAPLATRASMREAAVRYKNCLRGQIRHAAGGWSEFFEWKGDPSAVVEVYRDPLFGWRLEEARLMENKTVPQPTRGQIIAELRRMGVHVGRSDWELTSLLAQAGKPDFRLTSIEAQVGERFGDDD